MAYHVLFSLTYGIYSVDFSSTNQMELLQGTLVNLFIGVPKINHPTAILNALELQQLQTVIRRQTMSLFSKIYNVVSHIKDI